jgi:ribosomal protein S18 acetylase RimI-like enzyme
MEPGRGLGRRVPQPGTSRGKPLRVRVARVRDVPSIVNLLTEAATLQRRFEGGGGWPVPFPRAPIAEAVERKEFHVGVRGGRVVAAFSLTWDDRRFWGRQRPTAGYVHKLAVRRSEAHRGVGRRMIEAAVDRARAAGKSLLRLDCLRANVRLVAYYESAGFRKIRTVRRGPPGQRLVYQLFERDLG